MVLKRNVDLTTIVLARGLGILTWIFEANMLRRALPSVMPGRVLFPRHESTPSGEEEEEEEEEYVNQSSHPSMLEICCASREKPSLRTASNRRDRREVSSRVMAILGPMRRTTGSNRPPSSSHYRLQRSRTACRTSIESETRADVAKPKHNAKTSFLSHLDSRFLEIAVVGSSTRTQTAQSKKASSKRRRTGLAHDAVGGVLSTVDNSCQSTTQKAPPRRQATKVIKCKEIQKGISSGFVGTVAKAANRVKRTAATGEQIANSSEGANGNPIPTVLATLKNYNNPPSVVARVQNGGVADIILDHNTKTHKDSSVCRAKLVPMRQALHQSSPTVSKRVAQPKVSVLVGSTTTVTVKEVSTKYRVHENMILTSAKTKQGVQIKKNSMEKFNQRKANCVGANFALESKKVLCRARDSCTKALAVGGARLESESTNLGTGEKCQGKRFSQRLVTFPNAPLKTSKETTTTKPVDADSKEKMASPALILSATDSKAAELFGVDPAISNKKVGRSSPNGSPKSFNYVVSNNDSETRRKTLELKGEKVVLRIVPCDQSPTRTILSQAETNIQTLLKATKTKPQVTVENVEKNATRKRRQSISDSAERSKHSLKQEASSTPTKKTAKKKVKKSVSFPSDQTEESTLSSPPPSPMSSPSSKGCSVHPDIGTTESEIERCNAVTLSSLATHLTRASYTDDISAATAKVSPCSFLKKPNFAPFPQQGNKPGALFCARRQMEGLSRDMKQAVKATKESDSFLLGGKEDQGTRTNNAESDAVKIGRINVVGVCGRQPADGVSAKESCSVSFPFFETQPEIRPKRLHRTRQESPQIEIIVTGDNSDDLSKTPRHNFYSNVHCRKRKKREGNDSMDAVADESSSQVTSQQRNIHRRKSVHLWRRSRFRSRPRSLAAPSPGKRKATSSQLRDKMSKNAEVTQVDGNLASEADSPLEHSESQSDSRSKSKKLCVNRSEYSTARHSDKLTADGPHERIVYYDQVEETSNKALPFAKWRVPTFKQVALPNVTFDGVPENTVMLLRTSQSTRLNNMDASACYDQLEKAAENTYVRMLLHLPPTITAVDRSEYLPTTKRFRSRTQWKLPLAGNEDEVVNLTEDTTDSVWYSDDIRALKTAYRETSGVSQTFWDDVATQIEGKTASSCKQKWFALGKTQPRKVKNSRLPVSIASGPSFEEDDDIYNSTPIRNARLGKNRGKPGGSGEGISKFDFDIGSPIKFDKKSSQEDFVSDYEEDGEELVNFRLKPGYKTHIRNLQKQVRQSKLQKVERPQRAKKEVGTIVTEHFRDANLAINGNLSPGGTLQLNNIYGQHDEGENMLFEEHGSAAENDDDDLF